MGCAVFFGLRELQYKEFQLFGKIFLGGELRQSLQAKLKLDNLRIALAGASTPEAWWNVLSRSAAEFGWSRLCWVGPQGLKEKMISEAEPAWTFLVPLGNEMGSLQIDGSSETSGITLSELAAVIHQNVCRQTEGNLSKVH